MSGVSGGNENTYNPKCEDFDKDLGVCLNLKNNFKSCRVEICPNKEI